MLMRLTLVVAAMFAAAPALAQQTVTSSGPDTVAVTIYRAPDRAADEAVDRNFPEGFALITETRRIAIPAGKATVRFERVSSGILPESAVIGGLPDAVRERNLDADLLSPRSLYDRSLGRRVLIRRTNATTGAVTTEQAVIRSGADGGAVIETKDGFEAMHCTGLNESLVYDAVPPGLSAKPTLSIETDSPTATSATVTLAYLAGGFDWQANYVLTMRKDGQGADLFAWLTLVSSDVTSYRDAGTQVVAGKLNREDAPDNGLNLTPGPMLAHCWRTDAPPPPPPPPPPASPPPPAPAPAPAMEVVVTGARMASQEELGDLKLYRVAQPVTVAAKAQKQVAMLDRPAARFQAIYVSSIWDGRSGDRPRLTLRSINRKDHGLGLPLPSGQVAVFQPAGDRAILVGETSLRDKAVGEKVEIVLNAAPAVATKIDSVDEGKRWRAYRLTVSNANPWPVSYEGKFDLNDGATLQRTSAKLIREDGRWLWRVQVPANGSATLSYRVKDPR